MELKSLLWKLDSHLQEYGSEVVAIPNERLLQDAMSLLEDIEEHQALHVFKHHLKDFLTRVPIELGYLAGIMVKMHEAIHDLTGMSHEEIEQKYLKHNIRIQYLSQVEFLREELDTHDVTIDIDFLDDEISENKEMKIGIHISPHCPEELLKKIKKIYNLQ